MCAKQTTMTSFSHWNKPYATSSIGDVDSPPPVHPDSPPPVADTHDEDEPSNPDYPPPVAETDDVSEADIPTAPPLPSQ